MKKYLIKISLFFALVALMDIMCGWGFRGLRSKARGGQTYKNEYILRACEDDILILGSSKAVHHYVPSVFEDSLGLSCYNAGEMGCGIIPAYVRYKLVSARQKPKLVVYEVTPGYDYLTDNGYSHYLGPIRPYTNNKLVREVYLDFSDNLEKVRLISSMYRNNSKIVYILKDLFRSRDSWKGYDPLYGRIKATKAASDENEIKKKSVDSLKYRYFERLIKDTQNDGVPLVCVISPKYGGDINDTSYGPAFSICEQYGVSLIDNRNCGQFVEEGIYFQDKLHLNHTGAVAYSRFFIEQVKPFIGTNPL